MFRFQYRNIIRAANRCILSKNALNKPYSIFLKQNLQSSIRNPLLLPFYYRFSTEQFPSKIIPPTEESLKPNPEKVEYLLNKLKELGINDAGKEREIENAAKRGELNEIYEISKIMKKDENTLEFSIFCLMIAAKAGHIEAEFAIGHMYSQKLILSNEKDKERETYKNKAIDTLKRAVNHGSLKALIQLGNIYTYCGDITEAISCYERAIECNKDDNGNGNNNNRYVGDAFYNLAMLYCGGIGACPVDVNKAKSYLLSACKLNDSASLYFLGQSYLVGCKEMNIEKDILKAIEYLKASAEQNNGDALTSLGQIFRYGEGSIPSDKKMMEICYENAIKCGNGRSAFILADIYFNGSDGFEKDYVKALKYYKEAADLGFTEGWYCSGVMYYNGYGCEKDYKIAFDCYKRAAEDGNLEALKNMASMYYLGEGVEKDIASAKSLLKFVEKEESKRKNQPKEEE